MKKFDRIKDCHIKSQLGLYGGLRIGFGHRITERKHKIARTWLPNVQKNTFYSEILKTRVQFNVTTSVLKMVDRMGGIDHYILKSDPKALDSELGMRWRDILSQFKQQQQQQQQQAPTQTETSQSH